MSTTTISTPELSEPKPAIPLPAEREPEALFKFSTWVHVGVGAEACEEVDEAEGRNGCGDRGHFHAWCRLPNPLQVAEIRERALAARARKIRQLRDPETDAYAILQEEFEAREREGDAAHAAAVDELMLLDYWRDYYGAMTDVRQIEDPDAEPPEDGGEPQMRFAHIEDDQARFLRLEGMAAANRPADEYDELKRHIGRYQEAIDEAMKVRTEPKQQALDALGTPQLLEQLRDKRIENEAQHEFTRVYDVHEWLSCAYREPDGPSALADLKALEHVASEVYDALQATFMDLKKSASGN